MQVAIVEDHKIIAEALKNILENFMPSKDIRVFINGDNFIKNTLDWQPDLIISDVLMPGIHGVDLIKIYQETKGKKAKIIILSSITNRNLINSIIRMGVDGYLSKQESLEELKVAIAKVLKGEKYINNPFVNGEVVIVENEKKSYHLSPREKDVLLLVCSGSIIKEVAERLNLSVHTVQSYHKNIMRKFNVRRTPDLVREAIRNGFYNPES